MALSKILFKKTTSVCLSVFLYVCSFFIFVYIGTHAEDYETVMPILDINGKNTFIVTDSSDLTFKKIFLTNEICIAKNYLGLISFGLYPLISLIFNGAFFGMVVGMTIPTLGVGFVLSHTLPHSFELVAVVLSAADSFYLGVVLTLKFMGFYHKEVNCTFYIKKFLLYSIVIFLAALCESHVTRIIT